MVYKVVSAQIQNDGSVTEGKRKRLYQTPARLDVGGLYFIGKGRAGLRCQGQVERGSGECSGRQMSRSADDAGRCRAPQTGELVRILAVISN